MTRKKKQTGRSAGRKSGRKSLLGAMDRALSAMESSPSQQALDEAELFVCAWCARPVKVCELEAHTVCGVKMREGTALQAIRQRARGGALRCMQCGRVISPGALRRNPLAEICPSCRRVVSVNVQHRRKEQRHG